jgi:hypothetical protein
MKTTWYAFVPAVIWLAGCKSDLNQQLLERELRYQEDQIYQLQDELQAACQRLEQTAGENTSLKRQLGVGDDAGTSPRPPAGRGRPGGLLPPSVNVPPSVTVPPAIQIPDSPAPPTRKPGAGPAVPGLIAPPALEGVPPLPAQGAALPLPAPGNADAGGLSLPTPAGPDAGPPAGPTGAATPAVQRLSYEESSTTDGRATHLVVNPDQTRCLDADSDGMTEGFRVVFEPRDADERLVAAVGDVTVTVFDAAAGADAATGEAAAIARWNVPAQEALQQFRRTSRMRGVPLSFPWPGRPPAGSHVRVVVRLALPDAPPLETEATIAARPAA